MIARIKSLLEKKIYTNIRVRDFLVGLSVAANVFIVCFFLIQTFTTENSNSFPYLSPRIFATNQNNILINFVDLRKSLRDYAKPLNDSFGMYFEYLPSGVSIGINPNNQYVFVSLLKVPVIMAVYRQIEQGKLYLDTQLTIEKEDLDEKFGTLWKKDEGTTITVQDAIFQTLAYSDNTAKNVLGHSLTDNDILDVFNSLDIPLDINAGNAVVSPKNYSSILRSLYLSSYLKKTDSNTILNILTQSHFNDKIVAGVPTGVKVAHKIGVHDDQVTPETPIYTDCGIVYVPQRPYVLCIMMDASNKEAQTHMKAVSKMVYEYVAKANN